MSDTEVEIEELKQEQRRDDYSDHVFKAGREIAVDPKLLVRFADDIIAKKGQSGEITWGKPAKIAACRDSKSCGVCENRVSDAIYEHTTIISGIDFDRTERGAIIGAYCCCGFSF